MYCIGDFAYLKEPYCRVEIIGYEGNRFVVKTAGGSILVVSENELDY